MRLGKLDHVNIRTANLLAMTDWYCRVLGMEQGKRPPFDFPGAWLYAGGHAFVHLVGVERQPQGGEPTLEHFAFSASGLAEFTARLDAAGVFYRAAKVPGTTITQINVSDPDGNHIHVDFDGEDGKAEN
jgi:catechol 2,3-dioxygenase-like lactoylglutathione lyase family enzyme